jgi:predicted nucleotidyltransferase
MTQLDIIIDSIKSTLNPTQVYLFGSRAKEKNNKTSDYDLGVVISKKPQIGDKAKVYLNLNKKGFDWEVEPDIHLFSEKDFSEKLKNNDLFVKEISRGKQVYGQ